MIYRLSNVIVQTIISFHVLTVLYDALDMYMYTFHQWCVTYCHRVSNLSGYAKTIYSIKKYYYARPSAFRFLELLETNDMCNVFIPISKVMYCCVILCNVRLCVDLISCFVGSHDIVCSYVYSICHLSLYYRASLFLSNSALL